jgi:hypothetical protein
VVQLETDGLRLIFGKQKLDSVSVNLEKTSYGFFDLELKDENIKFCNVDSFIEAMYKLIIAEEVNVIFPPNGEHDLIWEISKLPTKKDYLVTLYFYNKKVKIGFITSKSSLLRLYEDIRNEFNI